MTLSVLIVEDIETVRDATRLMLEALGHSVTEASNGNEGLALAQDRSRHFDLILTDVLMPEEDGLGMILKLKIWSAKTESPLPPILALSGGGAHIDKALIANLSGDLASGFLAKPFTMSELESAIEKAMTNPWKSST